MESNLFYSLFKYRSTIDRDPLEDYFTELVGFLFNCDSELAAEWLNYITNGTAHPYRKDIRIFTQHSLGKYGRADLVFCWTEGEIKKSLIIEHKIGSPIGERGLDEFGETKDQIKNYLRYQNKMGDAKDHKVAIFKLSHQIVYHGSSPYFLGEFSWDTVYKFFNKFIKNKSETLDKPVTRFLCKQISIFMRRCNMVFENFTIQDLASLDPYKEFKKKRDRLAEIIINGFKTPSKNIKEILGFSSDVWGADNVGKHWGLVFHNKKKCYESSIWVHIGFSMLSEESVWFPTTTLNKQKIPDLQVVLALWPGNLEKAKQTYGNILNKLNHYLDEAPLPEIKFHIIEGSKFLFVSYRKPLSDFLRYEDQESEIMRFLETGYKAISNLAKEGILEKIANDNNFRE